MTFCAPEKFNAVRSKWAALALAACFCVTALFGSPLHDHDLDSSRPDLDCASCHLVHSNMGVESDEPGVSPLAQTAQRVSAATKPAFAVAHASASSRSPPAFC